MTRSRISAVSLADPVGSGSAVILRGVIDVPADFPTLAIVDTGDLHRVLTAVTDNDGTKTNTGQSFIPGDEIIWNGTDWTLSGNRMSVVDQRFVAGAGQTAFGLSASIGGTLFSQVFVNGIEYSETIDYTISGSTLTWLDTDFVLVAGFIVTVYFEQAT